MQIGAVFPQTEIGPDVGAVRAYAVRVQELGFAHILAYDHVLGADPEVHPGWSGPYDLHTTFHEPFVLFGYLAAVSSLELVTGGSNPHRVTVHPWMVGVPTSQFVAEMRRRAERVVRAEGTRWP